MTFREFCAETRSGNRTAARIEARELTATKFSAGGSFAAGKVVTVVDVLRENSLAATLNPTATQQEIGDAFAPTINTGATAHWLEEGEECPLSDLSTGAVNLAVHRVAARVRVSTQLLMQSPTFEDSLKADLRRALGEALDAAVLGGIGGAGEPLGLLYHPNVPSKTFGGAATVAKLEEFSTAVRDAKASGPLDWVVSPTTASKWRQTAGVAGINTLWGAAREIGTPHESALVPDHLVILGRWRDLWIHTWAILLEANPFTYAANGQIEMNANLYVNFAPLRAAAFCRSTDAGNQ